MTEKNATDNTREIALRFLAYRDRTSAEVLAHLTGKGIDRAAADAAVAGLLDSEYSKEDELAAAKDQAEKSLAQKGETGAPTKNDLARVSRRLAAQGFSTDIIYRIIGDLTRNYS